MTNNLASKEEKTNDWKRFDRKGERWAQNDREKDGREKTE